MTANGYDEELAAVEEGLAENLRLGYIEVAGVDADGQTTYRMTETGIQHVEQALAHDESQATDRGADR